MLSLLFVACCATPGPAQSSNTASDHWTGFYVGGNVGASREKSDAQAGLTIAQVTNLRVGTTIIVIPATTRDLAATRRETNWNGGFQAGYQWQAGRLVFGPEGDFNPFHRTVSVTQSFQLPLTLLTPATTTVEAHRDVQLSNEFSIRARAGVAFGRMLIYGTGGYNQARVRVSSIDSYTNPGGVPAFCNATPPLTPPSICPVSLGPSGPVVTTASEQQNMGGWTGGVGIAHKLGKRFSVGFEYRRTDYGAKTFALSNQTRVNNGPEAHGTSPLEGESSGGVATNPTRVSLKSDSFTVRFNFHF